MAYDYDETQNMQPSQSQTTASGAFSKKATNSSDLTRVPTWAQGAGEHIPGRHQQVQQKKRHQEESSLKEGVVEVHWYEDSGDFYRHLLDVLSKHFHVPESALVQSLFFAAHRFHQQHASENDLREGKRVRLKVQIHYDPDTYFLANVECLERESAHKEQPEKLPPATTHSTLGSTRSGETRHGTPQPAQPASGEAPKQGGDAKDEGAYPKDLALFTSFLVRSGYIEQVTSLVPETWRTMRESELTAYLSEHYTEEQLKRWFLEKYEERAAVKATFRKYNVVTALVIGLVWARDNVSKGEWGKAAMKVGGSGIAAYALNRLLYARDASAETIMKATNFGKWFQGAARTNKFVDFMTTRLGTAMLIWDLKDIFMSGGMGGPNIPFDVIVEIDLDDPGTWREPDQILLDFGFNIWYRQKCTPKRPEACSASPVYLGKIEGSATMGLLKVLDIGPHQVREIARRLYRVEGEWDKADFFIFSISRTIAASENILVVASGEESGLLVSGGGHYRSLKVRPANPAAVNLFGSPEFIWIPKYLLKPVYTNP